VAAIAISAVSSSPPSSLIRSAPPSTHFAQVDIRHVELIVFYLDDHVQTGVGCWHVARPT
jgi:hypothetical protein